VPAGLGLARYHSPYRLWLTALVGANLLQPALTGRCPALSILKKTGAGKEARRALS